MNRNGWGLRAELAFILMFIVCLVFSVIGLNRFGLLGENDNALINNSGNSSFSYEALENKLEEATKRYVREYYNNDLTEETTVIRYNTLYYNGYISKLLDSKDRECSGYTEVVRNGSTLVYFPYIKCKSYETSGYDEDKDW